jgi:hypothetical protein
VATKLNRPNTHKALFLNIWTMANYKDLGTGPPSTWTLALG